MRKKLKYKFIFLLLTILVIALFLSTSCEVVNSIIFKMGFGSPETVEEAYEEMVEDVEKKEKDEQERKKYEVDPELSEGFEEEEELIPSEPMSYCGDALGLDVVLIVNFKTTEVSGSINLSGDDYVDAAITDGKIDIETFEITANFSGIMGSKEYGEAYPFNGTIKGIISDDLNTFNGDIRDDEGDGGKFTAAFDNTR